MHTSWFKNVQWHVVESFWFFWLKGNYSLDLTCCAQVAFVPRNKPTEAQRAKNNKYSVIIVISWCLSLPFFSAQSTERKVICACENACTDSCTGYVCFFTWNHGQVERGCFEVEQSEQCKLSGIPNVYAQCCFSDYCNANLTEPKKPGQELWMTFRRKMCLEKILLAFLKCEVVLLPIIVLDDHSNMWGIFLLRISFWPG